MRPALLLIVLVSTCRAQNVQYLPGIQQRWDASDLVCIGSATAPIRTGVIEKIDGDDRDQLSSDIDIETCLKELRATTLSSLQLLARRLQAQRQSNFRNCR
ncbi:MAG: hypothetical protein WBW84_09475 [Acidobacteriaceae bacterium]